MVQEVPMTTTGAFPAHFFLDRSVKSTSVITKQRGDSSSRRHLSCAKSSTTTIQDLACPTWATTLSLAMDHRRGHRRRSTWT